MNNFNTNWKQIIDHSYKMLRAGSSTFEKHKTLLNLIKKQNDDDYNVIHKIY